MRKIQAIKRQACLAIITRRGQQTARSLGHIYLQHKGETKQASLPNELTTIDTIRALFVCAFPHLLTMEYMCQYELCDIEDVRHESVLRIHHSDPMVSLALPPQISMVSMNGVPTASALANNPYTTLHRLPPRLPSQVPNQHQQGHQQQQIVKHQNPSLHPSVHQQQVALGVPGIMQQHHIMHSLLPPLGQHHQFTGSIPHQISQIPPPKPRRMVAVSHSMHRLNPTQ